MYGFERLAGGDYDDQRPRRVRNDDSSMVNSGCRGSGARQGAGPVSWLKKKVLGRTPPHEIRPNSSNLAVNNGCPTGYTARLSSVRGRLMCMGCPDGTYHPPTTGYGQGYCNKTGGVDSGNEETILDRRRDGGGPISWFKKKALGRTPPHEIRPNASNLSVNNGCPTGYTARLSTVRGRLMCMGCPDGTYNPPTTGYGQGFCKQNVVSVPTTSPTQADPSSTTPVSPSPTLTPSSDPFSQPGSPLTPPTHVGGRYHDDSYGDEPYHHRSGHIMHHGLERGGGNGADTNMAGGGIRQRSNPYRLGGRASYTRKASRRTKSHTYRDSGVLWGDLSRHVSAAVQVAAHLEKISKDSIGRARAARIHRALGHIFNDARKMHLYG
jgi:hypothetical protein